MPILTATATQIRGLERKIKEIRDKCFHRLTPDLPQSPEPTLDPDTFWIQSYGATCQECEMHCVEFSANTCGDCGKDISKVEYRVLKDEEFRKYIVNPRRQLSPLEGLKVKTCECGRSVLEKYFDQ